MLRVLISTDNHLVRTLCMTATRSWATPTYPESGEGAGQAGQTIYDEPLQGACNERHWGEQCARL